MAAPGSDRRLELRIEELSRELEGVKQRLRVLERRGTVHLTGSPGPERGLGPESRPAPSATAPAGGQMGALFGRAAVVCFLLVAALVLRTLADSRLLTMNHGIWMGLIYAVLVNAVGWGLFRRRAGQAPTCCLTGAGLLGTVLLEGVFRHHVVPLSAAYALLIVVAGGTGWALHRRAASWTLWGVGVLLFGTGGGLMVAHPAWPWPVALILVGSAMAGRSSAEPGRTLFRAAAWLALVALWGAWGLALSAALRSGAPLPVHLAPGWFGGMLLATVLYFTGSAVLEALRRPPRWLDAFDAALLPLTLGWAHLVGVWMLPHLDGQGHAWLGWLELGTACLLLAFAGWLGQAGKGGAGPGLLAMGTAVLLLLGLPAALGGVAAVALWLVAAHGLAYLSQRWQSGGARLASYLLPVIGSAYGWFAPGMAPGGSSCVAAVLVFGAAAAAAALQYVGQRRRELPARSWFFTTVDRRDDTGALPLLAAVVFGVLALRAGLHPLLGAWLGEPAEALSSAQSVLLSLSALGLVTVGQLQGDVRARGAGVLLLVAAGVRVFGFDLLASRGLPLVFSVLGFGIAAGGAALVLRRPACAAPGALESGPGDE